MLCCMKGNLGDSLATHCGTSGCIQKLHVIQNKNKLFEDKFGFWLKVG